MQRKTVIGLGAMVGTAARTTAVWVWMLGLVCFLGWGEQAAAFDTACGQVSDITSEQAASYPSVLAVHTVGRATGTYKDTQGSTTQWHLGTGDFTLKGRGFVVGQFIVTAAHVIHPSIVKLQRNRHETTTSLVMAVNETTVHVGAPADANGIPAEIVHISHSYDLAILRPKTPSALQSLQYEPSVTWGRDRPGQGSSLLQPGTCVVALVPERRASRTALRRSGARAGHVVDSYAVSSAASVVAGLNPNTVTISTPLFPGDSGSPVVAFIAGKPRLVGVVTATRHPFEAKSYLSRIDPLLPMLKALQTPLKPDGRVARATHGYPVQPSQGLN